MDTIYQFLISYGYEGMFLASFLAGSVIPFASEAVLLAFLAMGMNPMFVIISATLGNVAGGMTCYWMGHLGNLEWIEKYFHVKREKVEKAEHFVRGRGSWMALFAFLPIIGSAISIALGMMRANIFLTIIAMAIGKAARYIAISLPFII